MVPRSLIAIAISRKEEHQWQGISIHDAFDQKKNAETTEKVLRAKR